MTVLEALKEAARRYLAKVEKARTLPFYIEDLKKGDIAANRFGPLVSDVARVLETKDTRRVRDELIWLEQRGHVTRESPEWRGTAHRWWPVGFAAELLKELEKENGNA